MSAPVGIITGTGLYELPELEDSRSTVITTGHGEAEVITGTWDGVAVAHIARHGRGHARLSHQVGARANIAALAELGVGCILATTVCGAVDRTLALGELVVFDDLHFPSNRLPNGDLCTMFTDPAAVGRGHWVYEQPFAPQLRTALAAGAHAAGASVRVGGTYGHVDGPRFNTRSEIAALAACGVSAVSQTAGPEVVLAGESRLPLALIGFVTDHANGVSDPPTPPATVERMFRASAAVVAGALRAALPAVVAGPVPPVGVVLAL